MLRFEREFHQSDFEKFKLCPRMFYYLHVLDVEAERISEIVFAGSAMHTAIAKAHAEKLWDAETLFAFFTEDFERRVTEAIARGIDVRRGTIDYEECHHMLDGYVKQPWNRAAEILLSEREFFFEIKPNATLYQFHLAIHRGLRHDRRYKIVAARLSGKKNIN